MDRVPEPPPAAPVLYADETPARAAGTLQYVHVACTEFLTAMHTGDRTKEAIDAGGVLPGYAGPSSATATRDMSTSPTHCMPGAARDWLRDLAGLYRFDPGGQVWALVHGRLAHRRQRPGHRRPRRLPQASLRDAGLALHPLLVPRRRRRRQGLH